MLFMNEWEIGESVARYRTHPVLGPATQFLMEYMREVNRHSDGWPYWSPPVKAAAKLMTLIQDSMAAERRGYPSQAKLDDVRKALTPIKAFMTRRGYKSGMNLPALQLVLPGARHEPV